MNLTEQDEFHVFKHLMLDYFRKIEEENKKLKEKNDRYFNFLFNYEVRMCSIPFCRKYAEYAKIHKCKNCKKEYHSELLCKSHRGSTYTWGECCDNSKVITHEFEL